MSRISATRDANTIGLALVLLLALVTALDAMAIDMYLPGMPAMAMDLQVSEGRIQQTLSIFLAGLAVGQSVYGPLLDSFGRRTPLLIGVGIFVAGSALAALAPSIEWLMAARFLQALGAAAGLVTPRAIVADLCTVKESARIFSLLMQVMMIAPITAPLLGGFFLEHGSWRLIFWCLCGLGLAGFVWSLAVLPDSQPKAQRAPLNVGRIMSAYVRQMRRPVFMVYTLAGGFILGSLFTYISASAFIFTQHFTLSPIQFSYLFAANSIALVVGGLISNSLLKRGWSTRAIALAGMGLHALAGAGLFLLAQAGHATLEIYGSLLALAIGALGLVFGNLTALTMADAGKQAGIASALMGVMHYLMSAGVGYVVSFAAAGITSLPATIGVCGALALVLCASIRSGHAMEEASSH